jgi:hypothetical protein
MFAKAAQSGPTETSAICPLSGKSDIAERSSSGRDYEYTPEHRVAWSQFQVEGIAAAAWRADHVK